jgi:hypothetical protein
LIQPEGQQPHLQAAKLRHGRRQRRNAYDYVPGGVYKITVALDAPLDLILRGAKVQHSLAAIEADPERAH